MGGCTTTENIRFTVTGISTKAIEYCPDLQRIEEKELSEVELLLVIKGWIERYEECKGRHKVLSDALQEIIHESK
jgi:hypothetical protein